MMTEVEAGLVMIRAREAIEAAIKATEAMVYIHGTQAVREAIRAEESAWEKFRVEVAKHTERGS